MKKVLVTGAGGTIGLQAIRFLLSEGKYEVTALELKDKHVYKRLKRFRKRINIVFGDVTDSALMDALIKEHDMVIHLAGVLPHLANVREDLCREIDLKGTMQIVESIKDYHPDCYLVYASSTSVYGKQEKYDSITVKSKNEIEDSDYYSKYKLEAEEFIKKNIKNYCILRFAYTLADPGKESLIYNVASNTKMEFISPQDAGYVLVKAIEEKKKMNKKKYNVSGGEKYRDNYYNFLLNVFQNYGLSIRFLSSWVLADKNYYGGYYKDGDELEEFTNFRSKNIDFYYRSLRKYRKKVSRLLPRFFALPFVAHCKKKLKKEQEQ